MSFVSLKKKSGKDSNNAGAIKKKAFAQLSSRRNVVVLTIVFSLLISGVAYFAVVVPQWGRVGLGLEFDTQTLDQTIKEKSWLLVELKKLHDNYESIDQQKIDILSRVLPSRKSVPELLAQLEAIARQSGVDLLGINILEKQEDKKDSVRDRLKNELSKATKQSKKKEEVKKLELVVEVGAFDYLSYKRFLQTIQSHARLMDIQRFGYSSDKDKHTVNITTYYLE